MAIRGTKKTIPALELLFETGKKPLAQDFFDWMASFYHKDEDISFLINIAKATLTDSQVGEEHSRFMTSLRVYQAILWHVRLAKLPLLNLDVTELVNDRITETLNMLMATDDGDNVIDTLGELFQAFQSFNEEIGGINALRERIADLELMLEDVPVTARIIQDTFDSLQSQVSTAQSTANTGVSNAAAAQSTANTAVTNAAAAQGTANSAVTNAATAQTKADDAWTRANNAQSKADDAWTRANNAQSTANTGVSNAYAAQTTANTALSFGVTHDSMIYGTYGINAQIAGILTRLHNLDGL